jgi:hypothetical protein
VVIDVLIVTYNGMGGHLKYDVLVCALDNQIEVGSLMRVFLNAVAGLVGALSQEKTSYGRSARLTDLLPGCKMICMLSENGTSILAIRAKESASGTPDVGRRTPSLRGRLKAIDGHSSVTVTVPIDGKEHDRTLTLGDAVEVEIDSKPTTPDDLKPGMAVWLKLSRDHHTVAQIMAKRAAP